MRSMRADTSTSSARAKRPLRTAGRTMRTEKSIRTNGSQNWMEHIPALRNKHHEGEGGRRTVYKAVAKPPRVLKSRECRESSTMNASQAKTVGMSGLDGEEVHGSTADHALARSQGTFDITR